MNEISGEIMWGSSPSSRRHINAPISGPKILKKTGLYV
ncbi:hypothetical protein MJ1HA_1238 [Metallosphaera sedula]|nr:hypothetical protein MJ1HA_1238 [Metallosphaera sedula]